MSKVPGSSSLVISIGGPLRTRWSYLDGLGKTNAALLETLGRPPCRARPRSPAPDCSGRRTAPLGAPSRYGVSLNGCPISRDGSAPALGTYLSIHGPPNWAT